jgi:superfamily II DNA or RNA helicase
VLNSARFSLARHILRDIRAGWHVLLIVDECHHLLGAQNAKILDFIPKLGDKSACYHVLALSATAEQIARDKYLSNALGGVIYRYGLARALQDGVVSDFVLLPVGVTFLDDERKEYDMLSFRLSKAISALKQQYPALRDIMGAAFFARLEILAGDKGRLGEAARQALRLSRARREMMHLAENRLNCACDLVSHMPAESKIILFGERIATASRIYAVLEKAFPGEAALYHSGMGDEVARAALSRYQSGEARILVTCRALDEGLDVPGTDVGVVVSSTRAERQRVQRLGRILRKSSATLPAKLYYIYMEDSTEETIYLEQDFPFPVLPMFYNRESGGFYSEEHEALAEIVLDSMSGDMAPKARAELERQLALCLPRGDFDLPADICAAMRDADKTQSGRNYWTAALLLARAREH